MLAKKQKLHLLKQAVIHMKNQLTHTSHPQQPAQEQTRQSNHSIIINQPSKTRFNVPVTDRNSHSRRKQINKREFQSPSRSKLQQKLPLSVHQSNSSLNLPSKLKSLRQNLDNNFYERRSQANTPHMQSLIALGSMTDRKYYQSVHQEISNKENEQVQKDPSSANKSTLLLEQRHRIKIFSLPFSDPILFPAQKEPQGKKIVKKIQKSPSRFLTQHTKCNSNLKFFGSVGIVSQPKGKIMTDRNRSLIFERGVKVSEERSCSKRHFGRYFQPQFISSM